MGCKGLMAYHNPRIRMPLCEQKRRTMAIHHLVLTGNVADPGPKLTDNAASAQPECRRTRMVEDGKGEQVFGLSRPPVVSGSGAARAAEEGDAGALMAIDGRVSWQSTRNKDGSTRG